MVEKLHYITQETETLSHIDCVREACIAGLKWIQLRVKDTDEETYLEIAKEAKIICDLYDVVLIINDNVSIAKKVGAHGVHIGQTDMPIEEARSILGENAIIGGTANTFDEITNWINAGADYIGVGPYKMTTTKKNLSPVLGLDGYYGIADNIFKGLTNHLFSREIPPIIAIGGIEMEDVEPLLKTGVNGIAVSGLLTKDFSRTNTLLEALNKKVEICYE
jgi:thiamine-phosphate pyrophosphorylase